MRNPGLVKPAGQPAAAPLVFHTYPYNLSYGNAFTAQSFGNNPVTMTLTAQQFEDVLEQQSVGRPGQTAQRIMQISNSLSYTWIAAGA